ncbi:hypothetical protein Y032_0001g235 [Ancylostoma ceylanicum]|uniref:Uncharacterized protein n=1 Tax=Ancylostoma ceylanicum TaxID=53326 RepID=A0A016W531_9BILA|nr:hypothetical protein Y032_0001g235 [Ancylostoma ceylanicum]
MSLHKVNVVVLVSTTSCRRHDFEEETTTESLIPLPSRDAIEQIGARFLDALIKKGQMEMAKGAFKTQLEVLEKVHPEQVGNISFPGHSLAIKIEFTKQIGTNFSERVHFDSSSKTTTKYEKYKKLKVEDLAADAVMQQAEMAKLQPKTGNAMIDMLNENGIPISSSLKGLEQAIKTQKEMETQDPSEQIAKAVLEKFQQQILPGLVANMIAGRNPFKIPQQMRTAQAEPAEIRRMALQTAEQRVSDTYDQQSPVARNSRRYSEDTDESFVDEDARRGLVHRLRSSPRLRALLENPDVASVLSYRKLRDEPLRGRPLAGGEEDIVKQSKLDTKSALVLGLHDMFEEADDNPKEQETGEIRRSPFSLSPAFVNSLKSNNEVKEALEKIKYRVDDVEKYLSPKPLILNPKPQPGYFVPRKLPTRPRKMLPLVVGVDPEEEDEIRRTDNGQPTGFMHKKSRVLSNLQNNPNIAPLFMDGNLEEILSGREILTPEQKGKRPVKQIKAYPRLFGSKTYTPMDGKVSQIIEERAVPPLVWTPKGRHTRLRWVGATEKEIPGIGGRFILPSLDPTMPAVNTAYSTQGRARDEWDTMFKIPNAWQAGDDVGFSVKSKSQRFVGGNGGFDMPAAHL